MTKPAMTDDDEIDAAFGLAEKLADLLAENAPSDFAAHLALCVALGNDIADSFDSEAKVREFAQEAAAHVLDHALERFNAIMIAEEEAKRSRLQ